MNKKEANLLEQASQKFQARDFVAAGQLYQQVMKLNDDSTPAMMGLAMVFNYTNRNREALELLRIVYNRIEEAPPEKLKKVTPAIRAEVMAQIGYSLVLLGHEREALQFFVKADGLFPSKELQARIKALNESLQKSPVSKLLERAQAETTAGKLDQAMQTLQEALKANPDDDVAQHHLGDLFRRKGDFAKAMPLLQQAIIMQPNVAQYHNTLGMVFLQKGEFQKALVFHRRAIDIDSKYVAAHLNAGVALKNLDRLDEAESEYRKVLVLSPNMPEAHNNLGNLYRIQGKLDKAQAALKHALKLRPGYPDALNNLQELMQGARKTLGKKPVPKAMKVKPKVKAKPVVKAKPGAKPKPKPKPKAKAKPVPKKKKNKKRR